MDNVKGRTAAFATFTPFKSHFNRALERAVLFFAPVNTVAVRKLNFLHTAHFSRVSPEQLRRAGIPPTGRLKAGAFLFISSYNGDPETYFRKFSEQVPVPMNELWRHCVDWKAATPYPLLSKFIRAYRRQNQTFVSSYPSTAASIRASLKLRRKVDQLCALAVSGVSAAEFSAAFDELAQSQFG